MVRASACAVVSAATWVVKRAAICAVDKICRLTVDKATKSCVSMADT